MRLAGERRSRCSWRRGFHFQPLRPSAWCCRTGFPHSAGQTMPQKKKTSLHSPPAPERPRDEELWAPVTAGRRLLGRRCGRDEGSSPLDRAGTNPPWHRCSALGKGSRAAAVPSALLLARGPQPVARSPCPPSRRVDLHLPPLRAGRCRGLHGTGEPCRGGELGLLARVGALDPRAGASGR